MLTKDSLSEFIWSFHDAWFLQTEYGNYTWSDPNYGGDNTIRPYDGTLEQWCNSEGIPYGRAKGTHSIKDYCGPDVKILGGEK